MKRFVVFSIFVFTSFCNLCAYESVPFIPSDVGNITDEYHRTEDKQRVILIADAHCNAEAQKNIFHIIEALKKYYGERLKTIGIEGSVGPIDTGIVRDMPLSDVRTTLIDQLTNKGMITGAERYDIMYPRQVMLYGIEDVALYNKNLTELKNALFGDTKWEQEYTSIQKRIEAEKRRIYRGQMKRFDQAEKKFEENRISRDEYLSILMSIKPIDDSFPSISLQLKYMSYIRSMDFPALYREMHLLINALMKHLSQNEKASLVQFTDDEKRAYLTYLVRQKNVSLDSKRFPLFSRYYRAQQISSTINPIALSDEIKRYARKVEDAITDENTKELALLDYYRACIYAYNTNNASIAQCADIEAHIDVFLEGIHNRYPDIRTRNLRAQYERMRQFYQTAFKRNEILISNMMKQPGHVYAMVVGGFHLEGIKALLRSRNKAYIEIVPNMTMDPKESKNIYRMRLKDEEGIKGT